MTEAKRKDIPSFYQQIVSAMGEEGLPADFSLLRREHLKQDEGETPKLRFADGARDGIAMYHTSITPGDDGPLHEILGLIAAGYLGAEARLEEFFQVEESGPFGKNTMLSLVDGMQGWLLGHREEIDPDAIYRFSVYLLREGRNVEAVKFALSLMELLEPTEESREIIRTLGLSDEFTLFCMYAIRTWEEGNEELFRLAKKVHGWGRIFLVHELEPETAEIRDWLLWEGWDNTILPSYSARLCAQKGGLGELLKRKTLPREEVAALGGLIRGLLDEGPVRNLSVMEDGEAILRDYLRHAGPLAETEEEKALIGEAEDWLGKHTKAEDSEG